MSLCASRTKDGSHCSRKADGSGLCWQHSQSGGVWPKVAEGTQYKPVQHKKYTYEKYGKATSRTLANARFEGLCTGFNDYNNCVEEPGCSWGSTGSKQQEHCYKSRAENAVKAVNSQERAKQEILKSIKLRKLQEGGRY